MTEYTKMSDYEIWWLEKGHSAIPSSMDFDLAMAIKDFGQLVWEQAKIEYTPKDNHGISSPSMFA